MTAVEVFKAIRGSVETDILPISMQVQDRGTGWIGELRVVVWEVCGVENCGRRVRLLP